MLGGWELYASRVLLVILVAVDHHSGQITALPGLVVKCHAGALAHGVWKDPLAKAAAMVLFGAAASNTKDTKS